ncbi:MAG: hypothetical protein QOJ29_3927 [Thermoleophilaceae bacterium]|jgi:peptidoglycan/xylan/chitin deacetylase (PgdA/CDA1 family)|nr:hypothetical protein [Thermoleophilaceae bacterium]
MALRPQLDLRAITYHRVIDREPDPDRGESPGLFVTTRQLQENLDAMRAGGFRTLTQADVVRTIETGRQPQKRAVVITFDDGYKEMLETVAPALLARRMRATFFVITSRLGRREFLSADGVKKLAGYGFDVGGHTRRHADLAGVSEPDLTEEVAGCRDDLRDILGEPPLAFAYPRGLHDAAAVNAVRAAGFRAAYTTVPGRCTTRGLALLLPRLHVRRGLSGRGLIEQLEQAEPVARAHTLHGVR